MLFGLVLGLNRDTYHHNYILLIKMLTFAIRIRFKGSAEMLNFEDTDYRRAKIGTPATFFLTKFLSTIFT